MHAVRSEVTLVCDETCSYLMFRRDWAMRLHVLHGRGAGWVGCAGRLQTQRACARRTRPPDGVRVERLRVSGPVRGRGDGQ
eukprot:scaffold39947_cov36-Tisochrysis_lutea.AAC.1